jgi:UDP-N-acetylglucosamine--N-acetylmuramyl-(pentapeptide) pyrophosphoryl-undecaprenol N-acetylglucosamine transferase
VRALFTGGGTGGHVYPALAVIERLIARRVVSAEEVAWVGRPTSIEQELVARQGLVFMPISTGALRGRSPIDALKSIGNLIKGAGEGRRLIREWKPDVVFSTGGYVTAPLTLAAWREHVPVMIYLPDMEPGLAVRQLSRFATRVCVSFDSVAAHLDARKVLVTGYPVRQELLEADRESARERLGLDPKSNVLLVLGGSTGAHSINQAISNHLEALLELGQIVHVSGVADLDDLRERSETLPALLRSGYHLYGYMHEEMIDALAAADLVVARAGASVLAEFPAVGLPAILVPYPYAGQHQRLNAQLLAQRGGAVVVDDDALLERLLDVVRALLSDRGRRDAMAVAMRSVSVPEAADRLADALVQIAKQVQRG